MTTEPVRLIFGIQGANGVVMHAESAAQFAAVNRASTLEEFGRIMYGVDWASYLALLGEEGAGRHPGDAFDPWEWGPGPAILSPSERGWQVAHARVRELVNEDQVTLRSVLVGSGLGDTVDQITGGLDALALIAERIDPARDGFTLVRDDAAVHATTDVPR